MTKGGDHCGNKGRESLSDIRSATEPEGRIRGRVGISHKEAEI